MPHKGNHLFKHLLNAHIKKSNNRFWEHCSADYLQLSPEQKLKGYQKLVQKFKTSSKDVLYRGTIGNLELRNAIETGRLGRDFFQSGKSFSFDLTAYIRDNDSAFFLSASDCPMTAKPYASCLAKMPCRGFIIVLGLPKVYTVPADLLLINKQLFTDYDATMLNESHSIENGGTKYHSIIDITKQNNETTIILTDSAYKKNWGPLLNIDVQQVVEVCGPGKVLGTMLSFAQPILISELFNPAFKKRQLSVGVVLNCDKNMAQINRKAHETGLIAPDNRFLTLEDANALDNTGVLDWYFEDAESHETMKFTQVPKNIPIGDTAQLLEHAMQHLQQTDKTNNMLRIK